MPPSLGHSRERRRSRRAFYNLRGHATPLPLHTRIRHCCVAPPNPETAASTGSILPGRCSDLLDPISLTHIAPQGTAQTSAKPPPLPTAQAPPRTTYQCPCIWSGMGGQGGSTSPRQTRLCRSPHLSPPSQASERLAHSMPIVNTPPWAVGTIVSESGLRLNQGHHLCELQLDASALFANLSGLWVGGWGIKYVVCRLVCQPTVSYAQVDAGVKAALSSQGGGIIISLLGIICSHAYFT